MLSGQPLSGLATILSSVYSHKKQQLKNLPDNKVWREGTAPVDRYERLEEITHQAEEVTLEAVKHNVDLKTLSKLDELLTKLSLEISNGAMLNQAFTAVVRNYLWTRYVPTKYLVKLATASGKTLLRVKYWNDGAAMGHNYVNERLREASKEIEGVRRVIHQKQEDPELSEVKVRKEGLLGKLGFKERVPVQRYIMSAFEKAEKELYEVKELAEEVKQKGIFTDSERDKIDTMFDDAFGVLHYRGKVEVQEDASVIPVKEIDKDDMYLGEVPE